MHAARLAALLALLLGVFYLWRAIFSVSDGWHQRGVLLGIVAPVVLIVLGVSLLTYMRKRTSLW